MTIVYDDSRIVLYHGDCLEVLRTLPSDSIDAVITSPPYNLGSHKNNGNYHNPYPDSMPEDEYQDWQAEVLTELYRLSKCVWYNHKNRIAKGQEISPRSWIEKTPWTIRQSLVWINGGPNHSPVRFFPKTERIYWLARPDCPWLENRKYTDVFDMMPDRVPLQGNGHTRTFPLSLVRTILDVCPWAKVVADPFSGSGTTLFAAKLHGRRAIGIEKLEKYCNLSIERLRQRTLALDI